MCASKVYLSGDTLGNVDLFSAFACERRFANKTNCPTHEEKLCEVQD